jgi:hypothetical protein
MLGKKFFPIVFILSGCGSSDEPPELCGPPQAPALAVIHLGAVLDFQCKDAADLQVGISLDPQALEPDEWLDQSTVTLDQCDPPCSVKVFARGTCSPCEGSLEFSHVYEVRDSYPAPPGEPGSTGIAANDPGIAGWAASYLEPVDYGSDLTDQFKTPQLALGPAGADSSDVVSLGRGGEITLEFIPSIADGDGYDLAVFENGITDTFLELGFVEVSSDGKNFVRFDHSCLAESPVDPFGTVDTTKAGGLAGKYRQGFGTPFDLLTLKNRPEVTAGLLDLSGIRYVKIVDVIGDGSRKDSFGRPIYDPYPTVDSAGFDLDAVAALNTTGSR